MSSTQWIGLAVLALVCFLGSVNSPQGDVILHPWRILLDARPK